jgi:hypothetical protein
MDNSDLLDTLEKLHQELEQTEDLDDESRQQLQHLMGDMRTVLEREEPASTEEDDSFIEQLGDVIQEYEVSHPSLTAALQHALDILSGAGI